MDPRFVVQRNFPRCDDYDENSFNGQLHEHARWAQDEYWLLEWALYQLAKEEEIDPELYWQVFRIFSHCFLSFGCHFDRNDGYKIRNLKRAQLYDCRERLRVFSPKICLSKTSLKKRTHCCSPSINLLKRLLHIR